MACKVIRFAVVLGGAIALHSCSAFLPGHSKSEALNESHVEVQMVTFKELEGACLTGDLMAFKEDYEAAFGPPTPHVENLHSGTSTLGMEAGVAVASFVVGAAIDYVKGRIDEEAERYVAQFAHTAARDGFWEVSDAKATQRYAGFIVRRCLLDSKEAPAFQCAFGFAPSADKQMFRMEPLSFITRKAKAKVLSDAFLWDLLPTTWFRYLAGTVGNTIDSEVAVEVEGYFRGKDQELHIVKTASLQWTVTSYSLDSNLMLRRKKVEEGKAYPQNEKVMGSVESGWFAGVPLSQTVAGAPLPEKGEGGAFLVKVTVTEKDTSNAKRYLEKASKLVADNKERVMKLVVPSADGGGGGGSNETKTKSPTTDPKVDLPKKDG